MPHANPKSRFVESTERKVYRNIVYEKYYVVYSVTKTTTCDFNCPSSHQPKETKQNQIKVSK